MNVIETIYEDHRGLAETMKKHLGIRKIVEDLYPKQAHFIYELLQNAEDCHATEAKFELLNDQLIFEHNGRTFDEADIKSITDIGDGTKSSDDLSIGQFGIGFKAVFGYCETPRVYSSTFNFSIKDLVLPTEIAPFENDLSNWTRFEFPFNSPKKDASEAFSEIEKGLTGVSQNTLLFLRNIRSIKWNSESGESGDIQRIEHSKNHIEIGKVTKNKSLRSHHYLRYSKEVPGHSKHEVSIAFKLQAIDGATQQQLDNDLQAYEIHPIKSGQVFVYFPAEKEVSGLRFHINGPFIPELSRAIIKDTKANIPLYTATADLTCEALQDIKEAGLLTKAILEVLPNENDQLGKNYECIRSKLIDALNTKPLTPTHDGSHAPASTLLRAQASLKSILDKSDLDFLYAIRRPNADWAPGAMNNSNADRMLLSLDIVPLDVQGLIKLLRVNADSKWFKTRSNNWLKRLYQYLGGNLKNEYTWPYHNQYEGHLLTEFPFIRTSTGEYKYAEDCYFPTEDTLEDELLPRVHHEVYDFEGSSKKKDPARKLLENLGVAEVSEVRRIEAFLENRYNENSQSRSVSDITTFISFLKKHPDQSAIFNNYKIFKGLNGNWKSGKYILLDSPFLRTGLTDYYTKLGGRTAATPLSKEYLDYNIDELVEFAEKLGASRYIRVLPSKCNQNPEWNMLKQATGASITEKGKDWDHRLEGIETISKEMTEEFAALIWTTLQAYETRQLSYSGIPFKAYFQRNASGTLKTADAQIVHQLRNAAWVPQRGNTFVEPYNATPEELPADFTFEKKWQWVQALEFGGKIIEKEEKEAQKSEIFRQAGIKDESARADAIRFAKLPSDQRRKALELLSEHQAQRVAQNIELPEDTPKNPERRFEKAKEDAAEAPDREFEKRERSISKNRGAVKSESEPYLRGQYTHSDGYMICQICQAELPFQLGTGQYYFEAHELIPSLRKHHYQNYVALCPNHGAMYKHINESKDSIETLIVKTIENRITINLGEQSHSIHFTGKHMLDIKAAISAEQELFEQDTDQGPTESPLKSEKEATHKVGPVSTIQALGFDPKLGANHYERPRRDWTGKINGQRSPSPTTPEDLD